MQNVQISNTTKVKKSKISNYVPILSIKKQMKPF